MKKLAFAALLFATPAYAGDVTITLNDQEQKVYLTMLDAVLKQGGLQNLQAVSQFVLKLQHAVRAAGGNPSDPAAPTPTGQPEPVKPDAKQPEEEKK